MSPELGSTTASHTAFCGRAGGDRGGGARRGAADGPTGFKYTGVVLFCPLSNAGPASYAVEAPFLPVFFSISVAVVLPPAGGYLCRR